MSDSVRPHRQQPIRLPCSWDSPGKNTGVGCHFLLQCMKMKSEREVAQPCPTLSDPMDCSPPGSSVHGIFQARVLEWGAIAFSKYMIEITLNPILPLLATLPSLRHCPRCWTFKGYEVITLEKEMATHSSILAWRIPRTAEPGGLPSMGLHRVGHDWSDLAAAACWRNGASASESTSIDEYSETIIYELQIIKRWA